MKIFFIFLVIIIFSNHTLATIEGLLGPEERAEIYNRLSSNLKMQVDHLKATNKKEYNDLLFKIHALALAHNTTNVKVIERFEESYVFAPMIHFFRNYSLIEKLAVVELSYVMGLAVRGTYKAVFNFGVYNNIKDPHTALLQFNEKQKCTLVLNHITTSQPPR